MFGSILHLAFLQTYRKVSTHPPCSSCRLTLLFLINLFYFLKYFKWTGLFCLYTKIFYFADFICLTVKKRADALSKSHLPSHSPTCRKSWCLNFGYSCQWLSHSWMFSLLTLFLLAQSKAHLPCSLWLQLSLGWYTENSLHGWVAGCDLSCPELSAVQFWGGSVACTEFLHCHPILSNWFKAKTRHPTLQSDSNRQIPSESNQTTK